MVMIKKIGNSKKRGFGSMDKQQRSAIASMGGKAAHAQGTAHTWTKEEARKAGRVGGKANFNKAIAKSISTLKRS